MSEDDRYDGFLRMLGEPRPAVKAEAAGTLTPELIDRELGRMWDLGLAY